MTELPSTSDRDNNFGLLRLFAASEVMVVHVIHYFGIDIGKFLPVLEYFPGVSIFFVISGFLISTSWIRSKSVLDYIVKRAARIYPALWLCILITIIGVSIFGFSLANFDGAVWAILQCLGIIFTPSDLRDYGIGAYNSSLWTIPIEIQFYIFAPIVIYLSQRTGRYAVSLFLFLIVFAGIAAFMGHDIPSFDTHMTRAQKILSHSFVPYFWMFLLGAFLRAIDAHKSRLISNKGLIWVSIYVILTAISPHSQESIIISRAILGVSAISVAYTYKFLNRMTLRDFDISYGIYIFHGIMINVIFQSKVHDAALAFFFVSFGTILLSVISWLFIERPMIEFSHTKTMRLSS